MLIAISTTLKPSRTQAFSLAAATLFFALLTLTLATGQVGELVIPQRIALALLPAMVAAAAVRLLCQTKRLRRLDISGSGQIRLSSPVELVSAGCGGTSAATELDLPGLCQLVAGSALLRSLLILRLQQKSGHIITLVIFRDSVSKDGFRRLSVAFRWIATQNYGSREKFL